MNIFYLDSDVRKCAQYHNDKHVIKMILETAQLLSTAHRVLDGKEEIHITESGRKQKVYVLSDADMNTHLYKATHINHPSAIWVRQSNVNYLWLNNLFHELLREYTFRYGKHHKCESLKPYLNRFPENIPDSEFTEPIPAMPDEVIIENDSISSYRNYYNLNKRHLASWSGKINSRPIPTWYIL